MSEIIKILPSYKIDKSRWDACISQDPHAKCYNLYDYVDALADDWLGLIYKDYKAIVPLPVKRLGFKMLYTPAFVQHFNIVGSVDDIAKEKILDFIFRNFKIGNFKIAELGQVSLANTILKRINFFIELSKSYVDIRKQYLKVCEKNLRKVAPVEFLLADNIELLLEYYKNAYGDLASYKEKHYQALKSLLQTLHIQGKLKLYQGVINHEIVFSAALVDDGKRLYYILGAPNVTGRKARVTYSFIDYILRNFAETNYIFDFEGSEIESVATFYKSFGPQEEYYYQYRFNRLPMGLKQITNKFL